MSTLLSQLNKNLALQMQNIMTDNPSVEELKAINEQTKQLTHVSKQIIDNHRLFLDAAKLNFEMGNKTNLNSLLVDVHTDKAIGHA